MTMHLDQLPNEVRTLILRKLRFARQEVETRLNSCRVGAGLEVQRGIPERLAQRSIGYAMAGVPRDAFRELARKVVEESRAWPGTVWALMLGVLTTASCGCPPRAEIDALVDEFVWPKRGRPFTLRHVEAEQFLGSLTEMLASFGLRDAKMLEHLKHLVVYEAGLARISILNFGVRDREAVAIKIDEFMLARGSSRPAKAKAVRGARATPPGDDNLTAARSELGRKGAIGRHAKDARQADKLRVRECYDLWKAAPRRYKNKAAFARDMMEKVEHVQALETIQGWVREWEKGGSEH